MVSCCVLSEDEVDACSEDAKAEAKRFERINDIYEQVYPPSSPGSWLICLVFRLWFLLLPRHFLLLFISILFLLRFQLREG